MESEIAFYGFVHPIRNNQMIDGEDLFASAKFDLCQKCFLEEVKRISKEYTHPFIERTGDGTRFRVN